MCRIQALRAGIGIKGLRLAYVGVPENLGYLSLGSL